MRTISDQLCEEVRDEWEPEGYYYNPAIHGRMKRAPIRMRNPIEAPIEDDDGDQFLRELEENI